MANHKRKTNRRRVWRKQLSSILTVGGWSRMIHKWWVKDVLAKREHKRKKY